MDGERIRQVAGNYFYWQGLRFVPFGFTALLMALTFAKPSWWPLDATWNDRVLLGGLALAFAAFFWLGRYYDRTFGRVQGTPGQHRRRDLAKWLLVYPLMGGSLVLDALAPAPLFLSGLTWAAGVIGFWWSTGRGRHHYLVFGGILVEFSLLPLLGAPNGRALFAPFFATIGLIYILGGIFDHLELRRLLPPTGERDDRAV